MRVLHVTTERAWRGGEQQLLLLLRGLARRGVEQHLVAQRTSPLVRRATAAGLTVTAIRIHGEADVFALGRILACLRRAPFDVVHLHTSQAHGLGAAAARLAGRRRPAVVVTRRVEHSIYRHSFLGLDRYKYAPGADRVLCVSERVRDVLRGDGIAAERLAVVPDGVDLDRFAAPPVRSRDDLRAALGVPPDAPLVGAVGALEEAKGHHVLVEALSGLRERHPDARVLLAGDGEARRRLADLAATLGVADRLVFAGFRDDVPDLLRAIDVFCFPSLHEGLGSSVLEAMAARVPVVASAVGGVPEAVRDGAEALLVEPGDGPALATAIAGVLADPHGARARAEAAYARVRARFGADAMVEATLRAYVGVVARLRRR